MKIIHIVENLDKGAVENWLIQVFIRTRKIRPEWVWTFYCLLNKPGGLDDLVRNSGGIILYSPVSISQKFVFLKSLRAALVQGKYDILHVHHDYLSGFYLPATVGISFRKRILHIHNNDRALPVGNVLLQALLLRPFKWLGQIFSDTLVGISRHTLAEYSDRSFLTGKLSHKVLYYGIDMTLFRPTNWVSIKRELGIPEEARLLLFVGRMNKYKNPFFVLETAAELARTYPKIYTLFVGQGELEQPLRNKVIELRLQEQVRVMGWRNDVASIMKQADLLLFPRLEQPKEGLGLVVVEAQAAGLPILTTNGIVDDVIVIPELVQRLPLDHKTTNWAQEVIAILNRPRSISRADALARMEASCFELSTATQSLIELYETP